MIIFFIELYLLLKNKKIQLNYKRIAGLVLVFIINLFFLIFIIKRLLILQSSNELNFGGSSNFIDSILTILIHRSIYFSYYGEQMWIIIRQIIIAVFAITIVYQIYSKNYSALSKITLLLFLMIFAAIMQHYLFNAFYPPERSSLIYVSLFALFIYFLLSDIYLQIFSNKILKIVFNIFVLLLLCVPLEWHFINNLNLKYTKEWAYDSKTKSIMKTIIELHKDGIYKNRKISISNNWIFEPSINYYRVLYSMDYLLPANRDGIDKNADFIYCFKDEKGKLIPENCFNVLNEYKETETVLIKKKPDCN